LPVRIDYLAERSITDNIEEETAQNTAIVVISYLMMFIYVSVSIGFFPSAVYNRFILGFAGITVVIFSLLIAIGTTLYASIPLTMISAEVLPFLILAIGVDNMFLISRAERSVPAHINKMELRVAYALKEIGPSIFAAAFCEALAFFIGMLTDVPALYSFCLTAGISVIADFFLQITLFIAALTLDGKRIQNQRADILFCMKVEKTRKPRKEWIRTLFERFFVPFLFFPWTQVVVFGIAACLIAIGGCSIFKIELGLN
jgi:Niemann-Pick C1 protein